MKKHIAFRQAAILLIAGSLFCILFGEGTHLHSIFSDLFNHGHIHTVVHAHPSDDVATDSAFSGDENHQHDVVSIDLNGIFIQSGKYNVIYKNVSISSAPLLGDIVTFWADQQPLTIIDLPPPKDIPSQYYFSSFSLRGPPIA